MAYLPGYSFDIFISYAHLDNMKLPGQQTGWIEFFYQSLSLKLAQRLGKMNAVNIWWDNKKLDGSKLFDASIEEGIKKSAVMLSLVSPGYLQSEYCRKEVDLFISKASLETKGLSVGDNSRILKVMLNNIPHPQVPEKLGRTTGFPFYQSAGEDDFGDPVDTTGVLFEEQLKKLRNAIVKILEAFPREALTPVVPIVPVSIPVVATPVAQTADDNFEIYMAEVSDSLRTTRKRVITELEKNGFRIVTNVPPPDEDAAHTEKVTGLLQQADLSVHLLDQFPGREIDGANNWYPKKQTELSLQFARSKLLWLPAGLPEAEIEEEGYKTFLAQLEQSNNADNKFEFIRSSKSELAQQISDYAATIKKSRLQKKDSRMSVLLDTHFSDQQYAYSLVQGLLKNNIQPYVNPQEDDPRKDIDLLGRRISQVNNLVFLYGNVAKEWVVERVKAALQLIITNNYAVNAVYIYLAPPNKTDDNLRPNQRFLEMDIINNSATLALTEEMLGDFIKKIKERAA